MSKEQRQRMWARVKAESNVPAALSLAADIAEEAIIESETERAELAKELIELHRILLGNGDPSHSLVSKVERLEALVADVKEKLEGIRILIFGDINKGSDNDTLMDKIKRTQRIADGSVKLAWIVLTAVILDIVGHILKLL